MRRTFLKAGLLTLASTAALTFAITATATTDGWRRQGQEPREKTYVKKTATVQSQFKRNRGVGSTTVDTQLRPLGDGIQRNRINHRAVSKTHRTMENPIGSLYAVVCRYVGQEYAYEAFVGKIDINAGTLTPLHYGSAFCPYNGFDFTFQTNVYRKGQIYCPEHRSDYIEGTSSFRWTIIDLESGDVTAVVDIDEDAFGAPYSVTYDEQKDLFYGVALTDEAANHFCIYDPKKFNLDGTPTKDAVQYLGSIGNGSNYISTVVYNPLDGEVYAFDQDNNVYQILIDPTDPFNKVQAIEARYLEYNSTQLFKEGVTTPMVYSPRDEMFVLNYPDNSLKKNVLLYVDPNDWNVYEGRIINSNINPYIASLICTDEFAEADAPELAAAPEILFKDNSLSGTITFTAPEFTYYGVAIGSTPIDVTLKIDDDVIFHGKMNAKETKTINANVAEGSHTVTLVTAIDGKESPVRSMVFYAGNDTPLAPANLKLDLDKLTWENPGAVGIHGGYVDAENIEYDIFVDGVQQNVAPVEGTEYTLRMPADMKRANIQVFASVNGKKSEAATVNDVIGQALELPVAFAPTKDQFQLFTVINANNDNQAWYASNINEGQLSYPAAVFNIGYFVDADDWLILPAIHFNSAEELYNFAFELASPGANDTSEESFAIYLAERPTAEAMLKGTCIYKRDLFVKGTQNLWDSMSFNFVAQNPGNYYIGIYCYSSKDNNSAGMYLRNFSVKSVDGQTSAAPGDSEKITIAPAEYGDQAASFEILVTNVDMAGKPLDPNKEITYTIVCEQTGDKATVSGKPGQTINVECSAVGHDGYADFCITPSNEYGSGYPRVRRVYVGIDTPLPPVNIKGVPADDNLSMMLSWDAPGNVGENGGYVDVSELIYNIYTKSGITYYKVGSTKELSTNFEVGAGSTALAGYHVGPAAQNSAGESVGSQFVQEMLGKPYECPFKEYWNTNGFLMSPYYYLTTGQFELSTWENTGMLEDFGDDFAGAKAQQGALFSYSMGGHTETQLTMPKIQTKGMKRANLSLRFWDYKDTPELRLFARYPGQLSYKLIETIIPNNPTKGQWNEAIVNLPAEVLDCPWVQFSIQASLTGAETEYLALDTWAVYLDCEYDLGITGFTGTTQAALGDKLTYNCLVTSSGTERVSGVLNIEIVDENGKVYATDQTVITDLPSLSISERNVSFELDGQFNGINKLIARATVSCDNDELDTNNVREIPVEVKSSQIPAVSDLEGTRTDKGVSFTWSTPTSTYGDFDNFEYHPAFVKTDMIGDWQNVDHDGLKPLQMKNGTLEIKWEGSEDPCAWTVVDAEALGLQNDPRAYTHSGKKYLMARCADIPNGADPQAYQTSKWLISPRIQGGSTLSFWVNTLSTDTEYFEIWYSTSGTELGTISKLNPNVCGDFRGRKAFSKGGSDTWELITYKVPGNAKYVAIRFCSFDGLALMIDDLSFSPVEMHTGSADHYALYRSDNNAAFAKVADDIKGNSFVDTTYPDSDAKYYLTCVNEIDGAMMEGPKSNSVRIIGSSVAEINGETAIRGGVGEIILIGFEGQNVEIFTTDGKVAFNTAVRAHQAHYGLEPGIYLVRVAGQQTKVIVK